MNKGLSIAFLVVGVLLIVWGVSASHSFESDVSRTFTGSASNKSMWLIGSGVVAAIIGGFGLMRGGGKPV